LKQHYEHSTLLQSTCNMLQTRYSILFMPVFHQISLLITSDCSGILTEKGSCYVPLLPTSDLFQ